MKAVKAVFAVFAVAMLSIVFVSVARADQSQTTKVTFNQPVEIPGHALPAGTYTFKLLDSAFNRNIVQIFNADQSQLIATVLAINNYRLTPTGKTVMTFSERPGNAPVAVKAWFYPHRNWGQEFVYPKARAMELAQTEHEPILALPMEPKNVEELRSAPVMAETPEQKEVEIAEVIETTPPAEQAQAESLPKTASPVPLIVLLGMVSFGVAFGVKRLAGQRS